MALTAEFLLQERFGFSAFRGFQRDVIERTMCGGHSLVIMPTGGGKSLCFQIPACLHRDRWRSVDKNPGPRPLTLVLSPLVALMKDQVDALQAKGIDATTIHSLVSSEQRQQRYRAIAEGQFCIAYVTPERFRKQEFLEAISGRLIPLLAIDEAHCISEWGHDFRPDYSRVGDIRRMLGNPPTIALTATATVDVQRDILHQLHLPAIGSELDRCRIFHAGIHRPNLELHIAEVWDEDAKLSEIQGVLDRWSLGSGIVYFTLIRSLEAMSHRLSQLGIEHLVYHGDLQRQQRHAIQDRFMSGRNPLVLATPAFGMGIDKEDIRFVVHAEIPGSIESYYQEIGRAGRDGRPSECRLLYDQSDLMTQMEFLRWSNPEAAFYERLYEVLEQQNDAVSSFGMEWLRGRLCNPKQSDRRLETALAMLERYDVIASPEDCLRMQVLRPLPIELADPRSRGEKLLRDQRKLYAMVEYAKGPDPRAFLEEYFQPADAS